MFRAIAAALLLAVARASAVILLDDGSPAANTNPPTGVLANSGWQYEGQFGDFLGTAIAPDFFITAKHIGGAGAVFHYGGFDYALVRNYNDAFSDFTIWEIAGPLPSFAPLYTTGNEPGQRLVVIGRGTQRGSPLSFNGTMRGWFWGPTDHVQRWGENSVTAIVQDGPANAYVYATFDQGVMPNESHLSSGDSGGAVFLQEAGVWKLAGINYAVDSVFADAAGNGELTAAIYDARDYYWQDSVNPPHYSLITGATPQPTGFYSTRVASKLGWIYSVIDPAGDADGNGISNRLDYARALNAPPPLGPGATTVTREGNSLVLVYRKLTTPNNLQYQVQVSNNMASWSAATPVETVLASGDDVQTIKASVPISASPMFLRIAISDF